MTNKTGASASLPAAAPAAMPPIDMDQALMLDVLGQAPVMFHRAYVGIAGSITGALWLSFAMARRAQAVAAIPPDSPDTDGPVWFSFSRDECEEGTGLTRHQQDTARRDLRQIGIVLERRKSTTEVAIHTGKLGQLLMTQTRAHWGIAGGTIQLEQVANSVAPQPPHDAATSVSEVATP